MQYPTSKLPFLGLHKAELLEECVHQENKSDKWFIPWYTMKLFYNNTINGTYARRKVGCHTVEYTTAFLYSDWLYFLWHDIKMYKCLYIQVGDVTVHKNSVDSAVRKLKVNMIARSFARSFTRSFACSLVLSLVRSFICSFARSFVHKNILSTLLPRKG